MSLNSPSAVANASVALQLINVGWMIANTQAFRTWTKKSSVVDAGDRIHPFDLRSDTGAAFTRDFFINNRPFAVIDYPRDSQRVPFRSQKVADRTFKGSGRIGIIIEDNILETSALQDAYMAFINNCGALKDALETMDISSSSLWFPSHMSSKPHGVIIKEIRFPHAFWTADDAVIERQGNYFQTMMEIDFD